MEDNENDDDNVAQNQDEHDGTNDDDDGRAVGIVCHKCKVIL